MGPPEPEKRFEEIYTAHYPAVATYVRRRSGSPDDIADVIAETFTTAWRRLNDVPDGDGTRLWLYGVARRVLANHFRAEQRRTALSSRLRDELATGTGPAVEHDAAYETFSRLGDDGRELLSLVTWEGLSGHEIAKVLGCSRGAARLELTEAKSAPDSLLVTGGSLREPGVAGLHVSSTPEPGDVVAKRYKRNGCPTSG
ncbi:sigma-70 family RNA polymerase sigma factor [Nonomuraea mesophila]|uniref:Sigma-70 family RNA polymerase sigma factor n=1 Tax=Nonomuraea mesophila TaxID=2530382 RepID=A0A4V2Z7I0_9ACTN|nr:sigma-70 family RNA polymerase sigma factor [Nonomuraea mesophila]TDE36576.1 sigma-70 family RNA polymerase sigma factor [Nonomuraea mesophila]